MTATTEVRHRVYVRWVKTRGRWEGRCDGCSFQCSGPAGSERCVRENMDAHAQRNGADR